MRRQPFGFCRSQELTVRNVITVLVLCAIAAHDVAGQVPATSDRLPTTQELREAPELVILAGHKLTLETYLWRDFQPRTPEGGKPLCSLLKVRSADEKRLPPDLRVLNVWILNEQKIWSTSSVEPRQRPNQSNSMEFVARGGPKWGPDANVDVIVRLQDGSGASCLLQAKFQQIRQTQ
ncbi:MAG: hypothetical protein A3K19_27930 [Lentisphaerae bacterium RIFOXYB12_FULL_65_16]|nr:MAG: hypothetical protein A3K18_12045 [Lentisphaerae bacterium RIFOXYA12_64_32]OGV88168.1 MAG: hypothetical protein A3K19_27930 [Lentisphaerae bacterium RIFOXYB12_FULL_65_16]